ncbi:SPOR domain-containing protein [Hoylesella enoeca]|uniref:SPOR domain-containing protein n=1 Tax=Hoylesella enoeca TaxID=76123 RepID=A0A0S2KLN4_9BACT|nr:SPOR domain-containing protein [Hoylesella enoeca]ALO49196.1 hypothetical protein AS203_08955 [Hoylesella enoeca]
MKQFVTTLMIMLCSIVSIQAQTFIEHIQRKDKGQGTVTVNQSKEIDELVNGKPQIKQPIKVTPSIDKTATAKDKPTVNKPVTPPKVQHHSSDSIKKESLVKPETITKTENKNDDELDIPVVDMRKKVMRSSYKVDGYRVQAFAGGNSRADKIQAQQIGNAIKMRFPDQPVYVHFYSPRWICRIGNYRSYEEASRMLSQIQKMGYKSAIVVRGKITVQE